MRAIAIRRHGGPEVLELVDLPEPRPARGEVRIRVEHAAINPVDWKTRYGKGINRFAIGGRFPKVLGHDVAGEVAEVGAGVTRFVPGDRVYAMLGLGAGAYAEQVCAKASIVAPMPATTSTLEAATVPLAALTSLQALRNRAGLGRERGPGTRVLVNGASGGVGIFAVQIARALGAHVTATCSERNHALVRALGADELIDYRSRDFTAVASREEGWDVVYDGVGTRTFAECRPCLRPGGTYVSTKTDVGALVGGLVRNLVASEKHEQILGIPDGEDLVWLAGRIDAGEIRTVVDSVFPLADLRAAHEHSETGRARGKIAIAVAPGASTEVPPRPGPDAGGA